MAVLVVVVLVGVVLVGIVLGQIDVARDPHGPAPQERRPCSTGSPAVGARSESIDLSLDPDSQPQGCSNRQESLSAPYDILTPTASKPVSVEPKDMG